MRNQAIVQQIFTELPDLEQTLFDEINRRERENFTPNDYKDTPFLQSKILFLVKKQFSGRF